MQSIEVMEILAAVMQKLADIAREMGNPFNSSYGDIASRLPFHPATTAHILVLIRKEALIRVNPITRPKALDDERRFRLDFKEEDIPALSETAAGRCYSSTPDPGGEWRIVNTAFEVRRKRDREQEERELEERATASEAIALRRAGGQCQVCRARGNELGACIRPWVYCETGGHGPSIPEHFIVLCAACAHVLEECNKYPNTSV
jgi:hypothetical protein